jgi:hypothetical protein
MALFYNPTLRAKPNRPVSKTATKKHLRELRKVLKELGMYDREAIAVMQKLSHLVK